MHLSLRNVRRISPAPGIVLLLTIAFPITLAAQSPTPAQPAPAAPAQTAPSTAPAQSAPTAAPAVPLTPAQQKSAQLAADTARLQELATELKLAMDKSTKDTLSLAVIKKAQEVEKLARKVRDEMRASLLGGS